MLNKKTGLLLLVMLIGILLVACQPETVEVELDDRKVIASIDDGVAKGADAAIRQQIASAIDLIVQCERLSDGTRRELRAQ